MSACNRSMDDVKNLISSFKHSDPYKTTSIYDSWADLYEQDLELLCCRSPHLAVDFLHKNFSGNREQAQVLDVACGTGMVAKLMFEQGFRHFEGVDGSQGMLDQAQKTGLYKCLRLAVLGPQPLTAQTGAAGTFDVVIIAGALDTGFVPVSVVRELCQATKPGGFICMSRGDHSLETTKSYKKDLERELLLMEEEGLWSLVGTKQSNRYMADMHTDDKDLQGKGYITGTVYLYKKSTN